MPKRLFRFTRGDVTSKEVMEGRKNRLETKETSTDPGLQSWPS